jgi:hypothetical protein
MSSASRIRTGRRTSTLWLAAVAVLAPIAAGWWVAGQSPTCIPIDERIATTSGPVESTYLQWITDMFGPVLGYPLSFVRWRRGYLEDEASLRSHLAGMLEPFDIIVVKNGYKLTDVIIPGMFTHVAIWLGDEATLRGAGIWDHPMVIPLQAQISAGLTVIESEPGGTSLISLDRILDSDRVAVIRIRVPQDDLANWRCGLADMAVGQVGRPYDYSFNAGNADRLSCAELVVRIFKDIPWQTYAFLGRPTIMPDDIAQFALANYGGAEIVGYFTGSASSGWRAHSAADLEGDLAELCEDRSAQNGIAKTP